MTAEMLDAAIAYAEGGWPVFPVFEPLESGGCSCGNPECDSPGKHPRIHGGLTAATLDKAQIREWWQRWPNANIGIRTGSESGIAVVDFDGDFDLLTSELRKNGIAWGDTPRSRTGGGGCHDVLAHPGGKVPTKTAILTLPSVNGAKPNQVDIRGDGGYVVAPPSMHVSGRRYLWELDPMFTNPAPFPASLQALLTSARRSLPPSSTVNGHSWVHAALQGVSEGQRNETAARLAGYFLHVTHRNMEATRQILHLWAAQCTPPMDERELDKVIDSIARRDHAVDRVSMLEALPLADFMARDLPRPVGIVGDIIHEGSLATLMSYPKGGKSTLAVNVALSVASATPLLDVFPTMRRRVLLAGQEDSDPMYQETLRKFFAGKPALKAALDPGWCYFLGRQGFDFANSGADRQRFADLADQVGAQWIIIDTLEAVHAEDPSNPSAIKGVHDYLRNLRRPDRGIMILDHQNKPTVANRGAPPITRILGATAKAAWVEDMITITMNNARTLQTVNTFTKYHAEPRTFGVRKMVRGEGVTLEYSPIEEEDRAEETLQKIADALTVPMTLDEIAEATGVGKSTIRRHRAQLEQEFKVRRRQRMSKGQPWEYFRDEQN